MTWRFFVWVNGRSSLQICWTMKAGSTTFMEIVISLSVSRSRFPLLQGKKLWKRGRSIGWWVRFLYPWNKTMKHWSRFDQWMTLVDLSRHTAPLLGLFTSQPLCSSKLGHAYTRAYRSNSSFRWRRRLCGNICAARSRALLCLLGALRSPSAFCALFAFSTKYAWKFWRYLFVKFWINEKISFLPSPPSFILYLSLCSRSSLSSFPDSKRRLLGVLNLFATLCWIPKFPLSSGALFISNTSRCFSRHNLFSPITPSGLAVLTMHELPHQAHM